VVNRQIGLTTNFFLFLSKKKHSKFLSHFSSPFMHTLIKISCLIKPQKDDRRIISDTHCIPREYFFSFFFLIYSALSNPHFSLSHWSIGNIYWNPIFTIRMINFPPHFNFFFVSFFVGIFYLQHIKIYENACWARQRSV
jgi:hypothetical protein